MEWFTSDTHFCHEAILELHHRPFKNVQEMDDAIINNINRCVKRTDTLYHLGDFAFGSVEKAIKIRKRINCQNVFLIYGNHDEKNRTFREFRRIFGKGHCHDIHEIRREGRLIVMCHYPLRLWRHWDKGALMISGHAHNCLKPLSEYHLTLDVGVDGHNFTPWSYDEIMNYMKPRIRHYNETENKVF